MGKTQPRAVLVQYLKYEINVVGMANKKCKFIYKLALYIISAEVNVHFLENILCLCFWTLQLAWNAFLYGFFSLVVFVADWFWNGFLLQRLIYFLVRKRVVYSK